MTTESNNKHWYVLRAIFRKEEKVRNALRRAGFQCYVPMTYRIMISRGHKVRRLTPAITELVFVHATEDAIRDFKQHSKDTIYWLTKPNGNQRKKIIVPDKAMEDFIHVTQQKEQAVRFFRPEEMNLNKGDRIMIHGGPFDGVEGVLLKIKNKREKQLFVSIPGIVAAAVSIKPEIIEVISRKTTRSTNLTHDTKELIRLAIQILSSPPDRMEHATEWDMLYQEIQRLYMSLKPLRSYLKAQEGELVLSLLMAEQILLTHISVETRHRFMKALSHLGQNTLTATRMKLIGGTLLSDETLLSQAKQTIKRWQSTNPTDHQQTILTEAALLTRKS